MADQLQSPVLPEDLVSEAIPGKLGTTELIPVQASITEKPLVYRQRNLAPSETKEYPPCGALHRTVAT